MRIRNAHRSGDMTIDAELDHPEYGWIPCTLSPGDPLTAALYEMAASGDVAEPAQPEPPVDPIPAQISRFQLRSQLYISGLLGGADIGVADADPLLRIAWADAQVFNRNSPSIASIADILSLSDDQVDDLFRSAAKITA